MKWVLDANVLVSALLKKQSPPEQIVLKAFDGTIHCVVSDEILSEYQQVLRRPKLKIGAEDAKALLDFFRAGIVFRAKASGRSLPDPKDQAFLDAALEYGAEAIITGNSKDFPISVCQPVAVMSPREAVEQLDELISEVKTDRTL